MKVIASLIIFGLCANIAFGAATVQVSQSISSSALNSTATKVYSVANSTDAANWNPGVAATAPTQVSSSYVVFGPGSENTTSYVYGIVPDSTASNNKLAKIIKRTLNDTIVGWGNDTSMASVTKTDDSITCTTPATGGTLFVSGVGPGYLAILSAGSDGTNLQVYLNLVSGTTATQTKITTTSDLAAAAVTAAGQTCIATTFGLGNVWYDIGSAAFFYTYWKKAVSSTSTGSGACGTAATAYTVHLGGMYANGTAYWTTPISHTTTLTADPTNVMGGADNWLNSTNIYLVYKDATTKTIMVAKTTKATTTTAGGSFGTLVADVTGSATAYEKTFIPIGVWASNYTYGVAVYNKTSTTMAASPTAWTYVIGNYLNGTTTYTDSGIAYSSATSASSLAGWPLTTGYTLVGGFGSAATGTTYVFGTFYANGTVNSTSTTLGTLQGTVSYYADKNGTMWVGWQDVDSGNAGYTYAGYLAKLQGQINVASGANVLTTLLAFVALFFAAIFAF